MRLHLDLAHPRPRPTRLGWLLLALGAAAAAWAGWRYNTEASHLANARQHLAALTPARPSSVRPATPAKQESTLSANAQRALHANWGGLLALLEQHRPARIALLSLEVDAVQAKVGLSANAQDLAAMLVYLDALAEMGLRQVRLDSHAVMEEDGEDVVRFTVHALLDHPGNTP